MPAYTQPQTDRSANRPPTEFARALRSARTQSGMSQADLAKKFSVQTQTISQWERSAKRPQPRFYESLIAFLELRDRGQLRALIDSPAAVAGPAGRRPKTDGPPAADHLVVVRDGQGHPMLSHRSADRAPSPGELVRAAVSIVAAGNGSLTSTEAEIVQSLLRWADGSSV